MESIFFVAGAIFGAALSLLAGKREKKERPEIKEAPEARMKRQWENLARYDGTEKGQVKIDD